VANEGGGIANAGTLTLNNSAILGNSAANVAGFLHRARSRVGQ
jgi:hypothetical protein